MTADYARALLAHRAGQMSEAIEQVAKHERDHIVQHRLAEIVCECRWCEKTYGEVGK